MLTDMAPAPPPIDLLKPRYDQNTYLGRVKHFLVLTNPLNTFASESELREAKKLMDEFKNTHKAPTDMSEDRMWRLKYLHDSAFHPDTGEKMLKVGRMSAQAPVQTIVTGCMITFYKTTAQTVFWQWFNQSLNAAINYTNRSGDAPLSTQQLALSYFGACGGALGTALYLNNLTKTMPPVFGRLVPFAAVCGANFINIPLMRSSELLNGTPVFTADGKKVGESKRAARAGIFLVCVSRVIMAVPGMTVAPLLTDYAVKRGLFKRHPNGFLPFQLLMVALCVTFAVPFGCALFDQNSSLGVGSLEPELQEIMKKSFAKESRVYFNKGL